MTEKNISPEQLAAQCKREIDAILGKGPWMKTSAGFEALSDPKIRALVKKLYEDAGQQISFPGPTSVILYLDLKQ